jgi:hypothetical protein
MGTFARPSVGKQAYGVRPRNETAARRIGLATSRVSVRHSQCVRVLSDRRRRRRLRALNGRLAPDASPSSALPLLVARLAGDAARTIRSTQCILACHPFAAEAASGQVCWTRYARSRRAGNPSMTFRHRAPGSSPVVQPARVAGLAGPPARFARAIRVSSVASGPLVLLVFAVIYGVDRQLYARLLREDGVAENLTVVFLVAAALFGARALARLRGQSWRRQWFYLGFIVFCAVGAVEEISWGQRIFGWESPLYFKTHSRQQETNVHNLVETSTGVKVKEVARGPLLIYG